jgi:serine acetyltransferase
MIKPGVEIGHGAVVGMGSVVTKDIEPYTIVGGNPARFIRYRFSQSVVRELLDIKWWELDASKLKYAAQFICDVNKFIKEVKRYK